MDQCCFVLFDQILAQYFKNARVIRVYGLDRREVQTENYKVEFLEGKKKNLIFLKRYKIIKDQLQIKTNLSFIDFLASEKVPVSRARVNFLGQSVTKIDRDIFSVFDFIDGHYFMPTEVSLKNVALRMAKMHLAFNKTPKDLFRKINLFSQKGYYPFNVIRNYSEKDFIDIKVKIDSKVKLTDTEKNILDSMPTFINEANIILGHKAEIDKLPKQLMHADFHPHNILIKGSKVAAIIDFENVRLSEQVRDIGFAIYRFGRQFLAKNPSLKKEDILFEAKKIKNLFLKEYSTIKPISKEELKLLPILLRDTFIRKLLFVLKGVYYDSNDLWINDLPKFIVSMDEINYFWPK